MHLLGSLRLGAFSASIGFLIYTMVSCAVSTQHLPIQTVEHLDLERFMGDWYVIGAIPTPFESSAYNATESYTLAVDGTVETTFSFRKGGFDGAQKTYHPRGFVRDKATNAIWGMQFIWPFKSDFRIVYINADYSQTAVGRNKRDYVWIMSRTPTMSDHDYHSIVSGLAKQGYDSTLIRKIPQRW